MSTRNVRYISGAVPGAEVRVDDPDSKPATEPRGSSFIQAQARTYAHMDLGIGDVCSKT